VEPTQFSHGRGYVDPGWPRHGGVIEERAGHGAGKPTSKTIDEQADKWAFMFANMGLE
jgi:hypothetical protein